MLSKSLKLWKFLMKVLDIEDLERIDSQKMYKVYDEWPTIAKSHYKKDQSC